VDFPEDDPCKYIKTGDLLELDGDTGLVKVLKKAE